MEVSKTIGLASIKSPLTNICLKTKDNVTNFDDKKMLTFSKDVLPTSWRFSCYFASPFSEIWFTFSSTILQEVLKLPNSKFKFNFVFEETALKLFKDLYESKAAGLDNLSGKFWKDGATFLAKPISQICNVSIKYSIFLSDHKIAKLKPLFKKGSKTEITKN